MAKIKKVKKYQNSGAPLRASSDNTRITRRNPVAEDKIRAKKAKETKDAADLEKRSVSQQSYYSGGEPAYRLSADTTGYSKGKQSFPGVIRTGTSNKYDKKANFSRERVDDIIKRPIGSTNLSGKKGISIRKKAKTGIIVPKKSSVSKKVGSAKKSIGNRSMKRK